MSVGVEEFVSLAKVVLSPLARVVLYKSMLWTLAVAEPVEFAMSALVRKSRSLSNTKLKLTVAICKIGKAVGMNVANFVLRIYKVVAAIYIAIMLYGKSAAAGLAQGANRRLNTHH